jgi:zinc protease
MPFPIAEFGSKFRILVILMIFLVPGLIEAPQAQGGVDASYVLDNGLKVIMVPQPGNPTITALLMVKAGSAAENGEAEYGLAHLMEHMAFKGTKKRGVGEVSAEVENSGGVINAYTSNDDTVYHLSLPAESLELGLDILSDIVFNPIYDPKEYDLEKEVVVEEIKRSHDSPDHLMWDMFSARVFNGRPYGHPVLGTEKTVREAGRDTALAFHDKFYRPDNAILVIAGGFSPQDVPPMVERHYSGLANPEGPAPVLPRPGPRESQDGPELMVFRNDLVQVPKVMIGFKVPPAGAPEAPQLDLLSALLDMGRSARLVENVKNIKGLVTDIGTSSMTLLLDGLFVISLETEPGKVVPAIAAVMEELSGLASRPPAADELGRARALATSSYLLGQESSSSLAAILGNFELVMGDYRLRDAYLPQWGRMNSADLARLAQEYFVPRNMTVAIMLPASAPEPDRDALMEVLGSLAPAMPEAASGPASIWEPLPLKSGARLFVLRDPTLPMVNIRIGFMGGVLGETAGQEGLANLMSHVLAMAPQDMSSEEFSRLIEGMGASVIGFSGRNSMGLAGTFIASNWESGLEVMSKLLARPAFAPNNLEEFRAETLAMLKLQDEQLVERTFRLLRRGLYGRHPYHQDALGLTEVVAAAQPPDLRAFHDLLMAPANMFVVVSGDVEPKLVAEALDSFLSSWRPEGAAGHVAVPAPPAAIKGPVRLSEVQDSAQTHLGLAFLAPGLGHPDQAALEVLDSYLSGLGGLLFSELRNKRSLAYTVASSYNPGLGTGSFSLYIASDPQKTGQATSGLLEIIAELRAKPLTDQEVQAAIRYLCGQRVIRLQTLARRSEEFMFNVLYGLGEDFDKRHLAAIEAVTAQDILRVAREYLDPRAGVMSVVGNAPSAEEAFANFK